MRKHGVGFYQILGHLRVQEKAKHCPSRGDQAVHTRRRDVSPFPRVPAGRLGYGEFTDPDVDKLEKSHRASSRQNHGPQLHRLKRFVHEMKITKATSIPSPAHPATQAQ